MPLEQIIVLALIQGITEFLPISSSGHLILVPAFTGWADQGIVADMVTNVGTLAAVIIYFWRDVVAMFWGTIDLVRNVNTRNANLTFNIIVGSVPIMIVGLLLKITHMEDHIRSAMLVAVNAIVFGVLMFIADHYGASRRNMTDMDWRDALFIGIAQAFSLSPGTSRSGVTMTAARGLGYVRPEAARFSFLLSIPANGAASLLIIGDAIGSGQSISGPVILTGILTFFIALGTITLLMRMVKYISFLPFVIYRVALGLLIIGLLLAGVPLGASF